MFRHCKDMQAGEQSNLSPGESLSFSLPWGRGEGGKGGGGWAVGEAKRRMTFQTL